MSAPIPQDILDALTDVEMPRLPPEPEAGHALTIGGAAVPVFSFDAIVIGSGAAGLRAAVELQRRGRRVAVLSQSAWGGTSACSGSDKQTLHTANTADRGDNYRAMARAIGAGGAMDEDLAYVEAMGSQRAMASLQYMGLPLPQDEFGGVLRYQTDHDEVGRATSCGPRTSRLMVKCLADEALRLGVPIFNHTIAVRLLRDGERVLGALVLRGKARSDANPHGFAAFAAGAVVLAGGGPGELYRDSVYPHGCFGVLGLALQAGLDCVNLTESQFGIGTRREGFPWNLSGSYVQVMPHIYSVDAEGVERHFLADYFGTTRALASNIFRKGYQWPFHALRMLDHQSSLIDLAIAIETGKGRKVFMDFLRNPLPAQDGAAFTLDGLDEDVQTYLRKAGVGQDLPIDRLRQMNPLAIELYRRYKIDIATTPLEFAVNNQHMNGGVAVDQWGRTSLTGCYAIGEAAGTHGVTRPGGAALNAGQVFGTRVAEHIGAQGEPAPAAAMVEASAAEGMAAVLGLAQAQSDLSSDTIRANVQARMSERAGILCSAHGVANALAHARALNERIRTRGIAVSRAGELARAVQWQQMAIASEAVLTALDTYIANGGGSRGARAILDAEGEAVPQGVEGPLKAFRFRLERESDRETQLHVLMRGTNFKVTARPIRRLDPQDRPFFERNWGDWLTGRVFDSPVRERTNDVTPATAPSVGRNDATREMRG